MKSSLMVVAVLGAAAHARAQPAPAPSRPAPPAAPSGPSPAAPATSDAPEVLTLDRAIEIAMRQQPSLRQSKAQLEAAQGRVDLARVARNPTIALTGSLASRSSGSLGAGTGTGGGAGGQFFSHTDSTGLGASASWRIYDFGQ